MFHLVLHVLVPATVAIVFFRQGWKRAFMVMMLTMAIDLDHLLADPIYDPNRCSIGFHPLHKLGFIALYGLLALLPKTRLIGLGLAIHMLLDAIDCQTNTGSWVHDSW